jgi:hypothetical protein
MCHRYLSSVKLAAVALLVGAGTLRAADIDLPTIGGEQAVFADGFDDNAAGWTLTNAVIGNGEVGPTTPQNGSETIATLSFDTPIDLRDGAVRVYFAARANPVGSTSGFSWLASRVTYGGAGDGFTTMTVFTDGHGNATGRYLAGNTSSPMQFSVDIGKTLTDPDQYEYFMMELLYDEPSNTVTMRGYNYDRDAGQYVLQGELGGPDSAVGTDRYFMAGNGTITALDLRGRNHADGMAAYFDAVTMTQVVPEPVSLGLLAVGGTLMLSARRRSSRCS